MHLMVTGGAGVVGSPLCRFLRDRGHTVTAVDLAGGDDVIRADLRVASEVQTLFSRVRPDALLHLAANKNVFFCEQNPAISYELNFKMTQTLVDCCCAFNARMIFLSSDYVFGKECRTWKESDTPCPTTQYGKDKAASEQEILRRLPDAAVVRTAGLYGFPGDLIQVVTSALSKHEPFNAFDNLVNCPTAAEDLFAMLNIILERGLSGIFHCVGPEAVSRFAYACTVAKVLNLPISLVRPEHLDFSQDVRPDLLHLSGEDTYKKLGMAARTLEEYLRGEILKQA